MSISATEPRPFPMTFGGGLDQSADPLFIPLDRVAAVQDMGFEQKVAAKRLGFQNEGTGTISGTIQARFDYITNAGTQFPMAISSQGAYYKSGGAWTLLQTLTGIPGTPISWINFNGILIWTNQQANQIYKWTGSGAAALLGGSPPQAAQYLLSYQNVVMAFGVTDGSSVFHPFRVQWTDNGNQDQWASGEAGLNDLFGTGSTFQGVGLVGPYGALLRRDSIWVIQPAPAPFYFSFSSTSSGKGCIAPGSIQSIDQGVIYCGDGMLYVFNGIDSVPVGQPAFSYLRTVNYNALGSIVSANYPLRGEYYIALPVSGATSPNLVLELDYLEGYVTAYSLVVTALGIELQPLISWSDPFLSNATWGGSGLQWGDPTFAGGAPSLVGANVSQPTIQGPTYDDFGNPISASLTTRLTDLGQAGIKRVPRIQIVLAKQTTGTVTIVVGTSDDGSTITSSSPHTVSMVGSTAAFFETDDLPEAEWFNFTISNAQVDVGLAVKMLIPYFIPRESSL